MSKEKKVQTNLKLAPSRATALDVASAVEGKDKAQIVEEALALREELMGEDYSAMIQAALAVRFSTDAAHQLEAIDGLRDDVRAAIPNGSVTVTAAVARLRARRLQPA